MSNFQVSILNGLNQPDISVSGGVITIKDDSSYVNNTEAGHAQSDFSSFRKIKFINPDGTSYLLSTLGDGDATTIPAAGAALPIVDVYSYSGGDGVYSLTLYTIPDFNISAAYNIITTPYVYSAGSVYRAIQNSTGKDPASEPTYWSLVSNLDTLPTKYRVYQQFAITCDLQICYANKTKAANCSSGTCSWNDLPQSKNFLDATKLSLILDSIAPLVNAGTWQSVADAINLGRNICCCNK